MATEEGQQLVLFGCVGGDLDGLLADSGAAEGVTESIDLGADAGDLVRFDHQLLAGRRGEVPSMDDQVEAEKKSA